MYYLLRVATTYAKYPGEIFALLVKGVDQYRQNEGENYYYTRIGELSGTTAQQRGEIRNRCHKWFWDNDKKKLVAQKDTSFHKELPEEFDPLEAQKMPTAIAKTLQTVVQC